MFCDRSNPSTPAQGKTGVRKIRWLFHDAMSRCLFDRWTDHRVVNVGLECRVFSRRRLASVPFARARARDKSSRPFLFGERARRDPANPDEPSLHRAKGAPSSPLRRLFAMSSVKVVVRVRPFNGREIASNSQRVVKMQGKQTVIESQVCRGSPLFAISDLFLLVAITLPGQVEHICL